MDRVVSELFWRFPSGLQQLSPLTIIAIWLNALSHRIAEHTSLTRPQLIIVVSLRRCRCCRGRGRGHHHTAQI